MFNNMNKLLFISTLITGTLISISANSWLGAWMGLELNLLSFIPLMTENNNLMSTEASLKYFLTQALASIVLLFSVILSMLNFYWISFSPEWNSNFLLIINSSLLLKMGAAPFHLWFPGVMEGLSWFNCGLLMTWQKIAPLVLITYCFIPNLIIPMIIFSICIGSLGGLNQTSLRKLMAYSSINHIGWMLGAILANESTLFTYFMFYSFLSISIIFMFNMFNIFHLNQTFSLTASPLIKFSLFTTFLSLGGLPPFLGFFPKWIVIQNMVINNNLFTLTFMITITLITLFFYLRLMFSSLLISYPKIKISSELPLKSNLLIIINFISIFGLPLSSMLIHYL
uniref:NADH-ubiquinone oxidoreductase chain 2 n=1 Tax=Nannochorista philpotti TaxID=1260225 RepID=E9NQ72_9NEOP